MVDWDQHKCISEYTDEDLLEQEKHDMQIRSRGLNDDRIFSKQYVVLKEIGKRWVQEHENMKSEDSIENQYKDWNNETLMRFYEERKEMYKGAFPTHLTRLLVEISDRWVEFMSEK